MRAAGHCEDTLLSSDRQDPRAGTQRAGRTSVSPSPRSRPGAVLRGERFPDSELAAAFSRKTRPMPGEPQVTWWVRLVCGQTKPLKVSCSSLASGSPFSPSAEHSLEEQGELGRTLSNYGLTPPEEAAPRPGQQEHCIQDRACQPCALIPNPGGLKGPGRTLSNTWSVDSACWGKGVWLLNWVKHSCPCNCSKTISPSQVCHPDKEGQALSPEGLTSQQKFCPAAVFSLEFLWWQNHSS